MKNLAALTLVIVLSALTVAPQSARATINLTANIAIPNITRIRVESFLINDDHVEVTLSLRPNAGGDGENTQRAKAYARFVLTVRNGPSTSTGLALASSASPPPLSPINPYTGLVVVVPVVVANGFDDIVAAVGNATKSAAAQKKAVEQVLVTDGLVFTGTVGS